MLYVLPMYTAEAAKLTTNTEYGIEPRMVAPATGPVTRSTRSAAGLSLVELVITVAIGLVLTAIAVPSMNNAIAGMRLNSAVSDIAGAVAKTRYRAIMTSQTYTLALTAPADTYLVTNTVTRIPDTLIPLANQSVVINSGANATYTFTLFPNGTVYGAGGAAPPALALSYKGRQTNIAVSSVGNVTTTKIQ